MLFDVPRNVMTELEYLDFERASEARHEFYQGRIYAMTWATAAHSWITDSLVVALRASLRGSQCRAFSRDMRVHASGSGLYTYPDVVVACPPEFQDDHTDTLVNPRVVFEVLSPSTESYDRGKKFDLYRESTTLQQYVLVSQDVPRVSNYIRQQDGVAWLMNSLSGLNAILEIPALAITIPLSEIFQDVDFSQTKLQS